MQATPGCALVLSRARWPGAPDPERSAKNCNFSYGCRVSYEGMIHFRIIGSIWLVSCLVPAVKLPFDLWSLATQHQYGLSSDGHGVMFWISQFLVEVSFLLIMIIVWGLIRLRRWAALAGRFLGVVSLLVCVWFILTQGMQHGPEPYVAIWCGVALSAYTIFAVWRFRPYDRIAEPGAAPSGAPAVPFGSSGVAEGPPSVS